MSLAEMKSKPVVHHTPRESKRRMCVLGWGKGGVLSSYLYCGTAMCITAPPAGRCWIVATVTCRYYVGLVLNWVAVEPRIRRGSKKGPRGSAEPHTFSEVQVEAKYHDQVSLGVYRMLACRKDFQQGSVRVERKRGPLHKN